MCHRLQLNWIWSSRHWLRCLLPWKLIKQTPSDAAPRHRSQRSDLPDLSSAWSAMHWISCEFHISSWVVADLNNLTISQSILMKISLTTLSPITIFWRPPKSLISILIQATLCLTDLLSSGWLTFKCKYPN